MSRGLVAEVGGFNLHAGVRVEADDRDALERLCRYMARPAVAAGRVSVLLITRKTPPCRGQLALPGTWVPGGAEPEEALRRAVKDETNLDVIVERRVGVYDAPERDPRGRVISHAYLCRLATESYEIRCREDAGEARFIPIAELDGVDLAFDHEDIVADVARSVGAVRIP